jgi:hypothetical protein
MTVWIEWRGGEYAHFMKPRTQEDYKGPEFGVPAKPEPDLVTLRLECMKMAVKAIETGARPDSPQSLADGFLAYVLNGTEPKR